MKNAMQLKAIIKNLAKEKHISAQLVMQNFMLERLLERISISKYQQNFILKGGFLIAAMMGLDTRATMDMDATIKGLPVNEQTVREMFEEICKIELEDDVTFSFRSIGEIREGDVYTGYRISLSANYPPMAVPLKLDITTGDKITPKEIEYQFKLLLEDRNISVLAYNLETIMAENLETVISRGDQNTRPRDYYDIYILAKLQYANIEPEALKAALNATTEKRASLAVVREYRDIMDTVKNSEVMQRQWKNYQKDFEYATDIAFEDACDVVVELMDEVNMIGRGFNVGKDIILKACLVLSGFTDISFKVDNFNRSNMLVIEQNWDELTTAFRMAVELISSFGFSRENITSNNLIIPIAYYIKSIGNPSNFIASSNYAEDRRLLKKWFIASLLNRVFSFMPDGLLKPVRTIIDENPGSFPFDKIANYFRGTNRDIIFTDDIIDNLLQTKYGTGDILVVLSVLYPWADLKNNFHIDHIYPKSKFTPKKLEKNGIPADKIDFYIENVNFLGNLQLLEATPNEEKNNKDFDEWLKETFTSPDQLKAYKEKHYIPDVDLSFGNFEEFLMEREKLIVAALKKELM